MNQVIINLTSLGLKEYEARVYVALVSLGPAGVADIHRVSEVPRNKVYETLDTLAERGIVEIRPGRPLVFRAMQPKTVVERLKQNYDDTSKETLKLLEEQQQEEEELSSNALGENDYAWVVKGDQLILRRKVAELISGALNDIFALETYPPRFLPDAKTVLKSAARKGVSVRAVSLLRQGDPLPGDRSMDHLIEYRCVKGDLTPRRESDRYEKEIINSFRSMFQVRRSAIIMVDRNRSLDIFEDKKDHRKAVALLINIPGVPAIQRANIERILDFYTRPLKK